MADPPAELLGPKPFKMGLLSRLLANSSFSTKAFEKNHPPHPPHPPDYSLPRSAELKLSALKNIVVQPIAAQRRRNSNYGVKSGDEFPCLT